LAGSIAPVERRGALCGDALLRERLELLLLADIETAPDWADFDRMRLGGAVGYRR
jgi:hypothetical protein